MLRKLRLGQKQWFSYKKRVLHFQTKKTKKLVSISSDKKNKNTEIGVRLLAQKLKFNHQHFAFLSFVLR